MTAMTPTLSELRAERDALAAQDRFAEAAAVNDRILRMKAMQAEQAIYDEFVNGDLKYRDAIERVQSLGYAPEDAEALVSEWADALEPLDPMRGVEFPYVEMN